MPLYCFVWPDLARSGRFGRFLCLPTAVVPVGNSAFLGKRCALDEGSDKRAVQLTQEAA